MKREEAIISKNSHMLWSAMAWEWSWEKSQCTSRRQLSWSMLRIVLWWMSAVSLSSCLWIKASNMCSKKALKKSIVLPDFLTQVCFFFGAPGAQRNGVPAPLGPFPREVKLCWVESSSPTFPILIGGCCQWSRKEDTWRQNPCEENNRRTFDASKPKSSSSCHSHRGKMP